MTDEIGRALIERFDALLDAQIERTKFFTIALPTRTNLKGVSIGSGACRGILAQTRDFAFNASTGAAAVERVFYIGDSDAQEWQKVASGLPSQIIPCRDLSEIYIRNGISGGTAVVQHVQVMVFLGRRDAVAINPELLRDTRT